MRLRRSMRPWVYSRRGGGVCSRRVKKPRKRAARSELSGNRVTAWGAHQSPRKKSSPLREFADRPLLTPVPPRPHARFDAVAIELSLSAGFCGQPFLSTATAEGGWGVGEPVRPPPETKKGRA